MLVVLPDNYCWDIQLTNPLHASDVRMYIVLHIFKSQLYLRSFEPHLKESALALGVRPMLFTQAVATLFTLHLRRAHT